MSYDVAILLLILLINLLEVRPTTVDEIFSRVIDYNPSTPRDFEFSHRRLVYDPYLYDKKDSVVVEVKVKSQVKPQVNEIRIFYAQWCPHCLGEQHNKYTPY
jgi:thiol-disulfide isomerase/thioredoxin